MLAEEILRNCAQYLAVACREELEDHRDNTYYSLVILGKLQIEVWWITERKTGNMLQLE